MSTKVLAFRFINFNRLQQILLLFFGQKAINQSAAVCFNKALVGFHKCQIKNIIILTIIDFFAGVMTGWQPQKNVCLNW